MYIIFTSEAWEDYQYWQVQDKSIQRKINELIKSCCRDPYNGVGKPEPLKNELSGFWSRRITLEHRLVYKYENDSIYIIQCRKHY